MKDLTEKTAPEVRERLARALSAKEPIKILSHVFTKLQDHNLNAMTLFHYVKMMQAQLVDLKHERSPGEAGFHPYQKQAIEAGFVKAMLKIGQDTRVDQWHGLSSYFALNSLWGLMRAGTIAERRELLREMLKNKALEICIAKINHPLVIHRFVGLEVLRSMATESFLGETLSSNKMADVIVKLCQHILSDEGVYEKQLHAEETNWQTFVCFGTFGHSKEKARKYGPRYFALTQEKAAMTIQGLLMTSPAHEQSFYAQIVQHKPPVLGLMFLCAVLKRPACYPESQVTQVLAESLVLMNRIPLGQVPGLLIPVEDEVSMWMNGEWHICRLAVLEFFDKFDLLTALWNVVEDEIPEEVIRMLKGVENYVAQAVPDEDDIASVFAHRGSTRTCVLRMIATMITAFSSEGYTIDVPPADLLSCLRITHQALRPKLPEEKTETVPDGYYHFETEFECFRSPQYAMTCPDDSVHFELQIADEATIGPTAHARVLAMLARYGILEQIATEPAASIPKGEWFLRLPVPELRKITSPAALRSFAALGRQRVTERKDEGARRFKEDDDAEFACAAYASCAELAVALVDFDCATNRAYNAELLGVRRDLVFCLGNAAQMMISLGRLHRGQCFATAAVNYAKTLPERGCLDAISAEVREKNKRRLEACKKASKSFGNNFMKKAL